MNFYRIKNESVLYGFNDPILDTPIIGKTLLDIHRENITSIGGVLIDVDSFEAVPETNCFVFSADLFFTKKFLEQAIQLSKGTTSSLQFALPRNSFNERFVLPNDLDTDDHHVFEFFFLNGETTEIQEIRQEIFESAIVFPNQLVSDGKYSMDQCDCFAVHLNSPFHLMMANLAVNLSRTVSLQSKLPKRLSKLFNFSSGRWYYLGLKRMNRIGKNCVIHPSAIIEGSVIGNNVRIGANAVVRLSVVGDNCYISDNVSVVLSVLGKGTHIGNSNYINSCLTYEEVFLIHGPYQLSVFGRNSACFAVINCDIRLDRGTIKIPTSKGLIDSMQPLLGIAYGHNSKTGGGNIIAAGRIVPNNTVINPPDSIILDFKAWE